MKYLKRFNESNDVMERPKVDLDLLDINDILLDINDIGYESKVEFFSEQIEIEILSNRTEFNRGSYIEKGASENFYEDVIETVERLKDYIENENYILCNIDVNLTHKKDLYKKNENLKGSRMMSNCLGYFKSLQRSKYSELYIITGINLIFKTKI
jgi:hypothetical protein